MPPREEDRQVHHQNRRAQFSRARLKSPTQPHDVMLGDLLRLRLRISSGCLSARDSAATVRTPPGRRSLRRVTTKYALRMKNSGIRQNDTSCGTVYKTIRRLGQLAQSVAFRQAPAGPGQCSRSEDHRVKTRLGKRCVTSGERFRQAFTAQRLCSSLLPGGGS